MKIGVQMYAIREVASNNPQEAFELVKKIGYDGVELAGTYNLSPEELLKISDGLEIMGAHIKIEEICGNATETIKYHKAIGNKRIICPWYDMKTKQDVLELAKKLKSVKEEYDEAGMKLYYHNHAHEFVKDNGEYLIDILASEVPFLQMEFDVYWVYCGNENPVAYLEKYKNRLDIFHAKDGIGDKGTTLTEGDVDMTAVCKFALSNNLSWAVVESEASEEPAEQAKAIEVDFCKLINLIKEVR